MVELTQSLEQFLAMKYPQLLVLIPFGHIELFTPEKKKEYLDWCKTDEGKQYLKGGSKYKETVGENKWISVKDRLPEVNTAVIAATDDGVVFQALYSYDGWDLWRGNKVNITHWMQLPKPPLEKGDRQWQD